MTRVAVLGAGSWGTALALVLARNGHEVALWGRHPEAMAILKESRVNARYLPDHALPPAISPTAELNEALRGCEAVLLAVPSVSFAATCEALAAAAKPGTPVIWATKGLAAGGQGLLHEVARAALPASPLAVLSGPSFAGEVAAGLPTAIALASNDPGATANLSALFHDERFRVYTSHDLIGVQLGGAVKNVLAIATGIADGLGFGANARAGLITRGLAEVRRLGERLGAQDATLTGLAGMGDLILTCTDNQSRNRRFGMALGRGEIAEQAEAAIGQVVEGVGTARDVNAIAERVNVEMPICHQVYAVLCDQVTPRTAAQYLMGRAPRAEFS